MSPAPCTIAAAALSRRQCGNRLGARFFGIVAVEPLAHFLARLEERDALLIDRHVSAGARIAAGARRTVLHRERAETAQLDPIAARERRNDLIKDRVHDILDIPL